MNWPEKSCLGTLLLTSVISSNERRTSMVYEKLLTKLRHSQWALIDRDVLRIAEVSLYREYFWVAMWP